MEFVLRFGGLVLNGGAVGTLFLYSPVWAVLGTVGIFMYITYTNFYAANH